MAGGAETAPVLVHDGGTEAPGELRRTVGRAVVDHDGAPPGRYAGQYPGKRLRLVEARQYEVRAGRSTS
ncbi:hypothetical protein Sspor_76960 [Streptomyces spororaveus]|uniref:Uncharacterized protein n=1 Tax=Streptomyces spororaveus TaxID=284039 RepID=A0ABQ3TNZ1_9ACTN|nr:hypothetical protein Sspor_76960 [Streptomyces spororaveus]